MPIHRGKTRTLGVDEDALFSFTLGDSILNYGLLSTAGSYANGIFALANEVSVINHGRIETTGDGAPAILIIGDSATVQNRGAIRTSGAPTPEYTSDGIAIYGNGGQVVSYGSIQASGLGASAAFAYGDSNHLTNHGSMVTSGPLGGTLGAIGAFNLVENFGSVVATGPRGSAMLTFGFANSLANYGVITVSFGDFAQGMWGFGPLSTVNNFGTLRMSGAANAAAILLEGDGSAAFNSGRITVDNQYGFGMGATGFAGNVGLALENAGTIVTSGDYGLAMALGVPRFASIPGTPTEDHRAWSPIEGGHLLNTGSIVTSGNAAAGIVTAGSNTTIMNSGSVTTSGGAADFGPMGSFAASALIATGSNLTIVNSAGAVLKSSHAASPTVQINTIASDVGELAGDSMLLNYGTISARIIAVLGGSANETIVNHGLIDGRVDLGAGNDVYVAGSGGHLVGTLMTGSGADLIVVQNGSGHTVIGDFDDDDVLDFSAFGYMSLDSVLSAATMSVDGLLIKLDSDDSVMLTGLGAADLAADNFIFASAPLAEAHQFWSAPLAHADLLWA